MKAILSSLATAAAMAAGLSISTPALADDAPAAKAGSAYKLLTAIKTDAQGPIQAFRIDSAARRLFVARQGAVEAIDIDSGAKVAQVAVPGTVSAIALAPDLSRGYAASLTDGSVTLFDTKTMQIVKTVKLGGAEPAAIEYEPKTKRLFVSHQKGGRLSVLAADSGDSIGVATLGGKLRGVTADTRGNVYVADEEQNTLHVVDARDLKTKGQMATWPATKPTAVTIDDKERRIYVATASGRMVVVDPDIGQMIGYVPIGKGDGGIAAQFAPNRFVRLFVPTADGQLTVVQNAKLTASVESTLPNAGTRSTAVAVDGKSGKAYLASASDILVLAK